MTLKQKILKLKLELYEDCLTSDSVGLGADPVKVVFVPGESSGVSDLTSGGGSEGDNSDLLPLLSSGSVLVDNIELHVERSARVSVAGSLSSSGVNADNSISDNAVDGVTFSVGDDWQIFDHSENGGDSSGVVAGLAPSGGGDELANIGGVSGGRLTAGLDVVIEGDGGWKLDQGNVVGEGVGVPVGVGPAVEGGDLDSVRFRGLSDVVSSGHDVKVGGAISTVGGGQDVVLRDESSATEPGVVDEQSHLPGPLVGLGLESTNNSVLGWRSFNSALGLEVVGGGLEGGLGLAAGLDGPGELDVGVLVGAGLGIDQSVSGGVLGDVPGGGGPPVLLGSQDTAIGQGQSGATKQSCENNPHGLRFSLRIPC